MERKRKRPVGRPRGEASVVINVRMPSSLLERFDRYLDRRERRTLEVVNRGMVIRELLEDMLEGEGL
jgi:metal-responsive CopG/Arc/MetJ family transcriptional regulator